MFTLIGLHDWWNATKPEIAKENLNSEIETLKKILPYYDLGLFTSYDISHIRMAVPKQSFPINPVYHQVHIELLQAMYAITRESVFKNYAEKWQSYVSPINYMKT